MLFQNKVSKQWNIGLVWKKKSIFRVTFTIYWQGMFHSLVAMALILRTWTLFFPPTKCWDAVLYKKPTRRAVLSQSHLFKRRYMSCAHGRAEHLTSWRTGLYFHNKPLILNIWTRTSDANIHRFPQTVSQTCNYWRMKCSMCGRYCSNRAAAVFWNECTWWVSFCVCVGWYRA